VTRGATWHWLDRRLFDKTGARWLKDKFAILRREMNVNVEWHDRLLYIFGEEYLHYRRAWTLQFYDEDVAAEFVDALHTRCIHVGTDRCINPAWRHVITWSTTAIVRSRVLRSKSIPMYGLTTWSVRDVILLHGRNTMYVLSAHFPATYLT